MQIIFKSGIINLGDNVKTVKKIFIVLLLTLMVGGCNYTNKENENPIEKQKEQQPAIDEEETKKKDPIDVNTSSGIALIGMIKKENNEWYFILDTPINLILETYIDHKEEFKNVYKIKMLDDDLYGVKKEIYINELVTITGIISNPRSAGILNLIPYTIKRGKTIDVNASISNIVAPEENVTYDENKIHDKMKSIIKDNKYEYNYYKLSDETLKTFGTDFIDFYISFVDAYINYETIVKCDNKTYFYNLISLIEHDFPIFNIDANLDVINGYNEASKTIIIKYTSTKEEHDKFISKFLKSANEFLKGVTPNMSDSLKAQIIYHNLSSNIKYNYDALNNLEKGLSIYVYLNHNGICHSFADAYCQLLNQVDIDCTIAAGVPKDSSIGHAWSAFKIDDEWYFADPTYELSYKDGNYYAYYGMNLEQRLNKDEFASDKLFIGKYNSTIVSQFAKFDKTLQVNSF